MALPPAALGSLSRRPQRGNTESQRGYAEEDPRGSIICGASSMAALPTSRAAKVPARPHFCGAAGSPPPPMLEARPEPPFGAEVPARPHFRSGKRPRYHFRKCPRGTSNAALPTSRAAKVPAWPHFRTRKRLGAAFAPNRKKRMISGPGTSRTPLRSLTAAITQFRPRKCGFGS